MGEILVFAGAGSLAALTYSLLLMLSALKAEGVISEEAEKVSLAIREGAAAFLKRQYLVITLVGLTIFLLLFVFAGFQISFSFLIGAIFSALSGIAGMQVAVRSNLKTAIAAEKGLSPAFKTAFRGGAVTGFLVAGLGLLSLSMVYWLFGNLNALIGLAFGGSLISIFARLGGGIYTKAADIGADLVGKVEAGIPEDDPRNPAVIADNVGDNVGDCAGMAADLFETYVVTLTSSMLLGGLTFPAEEKFVLLPLLLGAVSILASIGGSLFVQVKKSSKNIMSALYRGLIVSAALAVLGFYPTLKYLFPLDFPYHYFLSLTLGIAATAAIFVITEYFTSKAFAPVQKIARASLAGHGPNIIAGLANSMESTALPILVLTAAVFFSFKLAGLYGIGLCAVAFLSLVGMVVAVDSFGPITDNAGGIAEMANFSSQTREVTDALDSVGNTTKAITKGYAIGSAVLAAAVLFAVFQQEVIKKTTTVNFALNDPNVLIGLFLGALIPYLFSAYAMEAVSKAAGSVVDEVRRQFRQIPGLLEGKTSPDYKTAVDIVTKAALREMIAPALLPVIAPLLVGFLLGVKVLGGMLVGTILTGAFLAISMTTGGAAWDNAKKFIEAGNLGGKGSEAHKAAITGDTVGDPYKDTAGPAINPLIKIINLVALLLVPFLR